MSNRIGQATAIGGYLERVEIETDERNGSQTTYHYRGSQIECAAIALNMRALGAVRIYRAPTGDGEWTVRASFPWNQEDGGPTIDPPTDIMELDVGVAQTPWQQNKPLRNQYAALGLNEVGINYQFAIITDVSNRYLRGEISADDDNNKTKEEVAEDEITARCGAAASLSLKVFRMVAYRETTSFIEYTTSFRRSITADSPLQVKASFVGVGKIYTTAEVESAEGIPSDGWFVLPPGMLWHKSQPTVKSVAGHKTEIAYSYTGMATATGLLYEAYSAATLLDA